MANKFIPFYDRVQIRPFKRDSWVPDESLLEKGEVIAVGEKCTFLKKGDTVFFTSWGMDKTPDEDGEPYYVIPEKSEFILGKYHGKKRV